MNEQNIFSNFGNETPLLRQMTPAEILQKFQTCQSSHTLVKAKTNQTTPLFGCPTCGIYYSQIKDILTINSIKQSQDHLFGFEKIMSNYRQNLESLKGIIDSLKSGQSFSFGPNHLALYSFILDNNHLSIIQTVQLTQRSGQATITKK